MDLTGKNALISGATSGIGRETAIALAKMGAHVCLIGRNQTKTENLCTTIMEAQPEAQERAGAVRSGRAVGGALFPERR